MTQTVLILGGSGKIGTHAAEAFWNAGWTVRQYRRGTDMSAAAMGADVIINGLNPPNYHNWAKTIPAITTQVIAAARASGATVVIPGNVYNFGNQGRVWDETTPQRPVTEKGQIRVDMEAAYRAAGVQTIILRAGNFIDPNRDGDVYSKLLVSKAGKGIVQALGPADTLQEYTYLPDWARAVVQIVEQRETLAVFEDIPFPSHPFTLEQLREILARRLGRQMRITAFPWWLMRPLSPFSELIREFRKMQYLFATPHQLGARKFKRILPDFHWTALETVLLSGLPADVHPNEPVRTRSKPIAAE